MRILVTGTAGFIGNAVTLALLERGELVAGVDDVTPYDTLKEARLARLIPYGTNFQEFRLDITSPAFLEVVHTFQPEAILHLAARTGLRESVSAPRPYAATNLMGFFNVLEACRRNGIRHLVYASSSSVYGQTAGEMRPMSNTDNPLNFYAATKKCNEVMAASYAHLYNISCIGLRMFTVYGPWGRPDMAMAMWTKLILANRSIAIHRSEGVDSVARDWTYIDDVVDCWLWALALPYGIENNIYNVGRGQPEELTHVVGLLETALGKTVVKGLIHLQNGEAVTTYAGAGRQLMRHKPVSIEDGIDRYTKWYLAHYK